MAYKKLRQTVPKKRFVFTIFNGKSVRRIRIRSHSAQEGKKIISEIYPQWNVLFERES